MESPINNNLEDGLTKESVSYKNKFVFTLITLIVITIIFVVILVIVIVSKGEENEQPSEKKDDSSPSTLEWQELPYPQVLENVDCINKEKDMNSKFSYNLWNTPKRGDK